MRIGSGDILLLSSGEVTEVDGIPILDYARGEYTVPCSHGRALRGEIRTPYLGANYDELIPNDCESGILKVFRSCEISDKEIEIENLKLKYENKCLLLAEDQYLDKISILEDRLNIIKKTIKILNER
jgi:hypothetical protein